MDVRSRVYATTFSNACTKSFGRQLGLTKSSRKRTQLQKLVSRYGMSLIFLKFTIQCGIQLKR